MATPRTTRTPVLRRCAPLLAAGALAAQLIGSSTSAAAPVTTTLPTRTIAAKAAKAKVGAPYVYGATGPRTFDCSGLVGFAYRVAKHPLPVRTSQQMWRIGARVRRAAVKPGDIVFAWDRRLGHVGIAIGAGKMVHAPRPGQRVRVAAIPAGRDFVGAVRP